ncbi:MAG: histidine phosphatase family protein [Chitinophagales bacterium]|nr:histidine phosphatase family protein [Chitinophagales bacterium]
MKTIYLIRHGKSSWHYPELNDRERPLKNRGANDAHLMGKLLDKKKIEPDAILTSPARRALDTAIIFADELGFKQNIKIEEGLYFKGMDGILEVIRTANNDWGTVFLFGHNPDFLEFTNTYADDPYDNLPTCGVVAIQYDVKKWEEASHENGKLKSFDCPSKHK